jgi:hypothetical protein
MILKTYIKEKGYCENSPIKTESGSKVDQTLANPRYQWIRAGSSPAFGTIQIFFS